MMNVETDSLKEDGISDFLSIEGRFNLTWLAVVGSWYYVKVEHFVVFKVIPKNDKAVLIEDI